MLIYLFVIFTFGWCVCWLIFQQYGRDSELVESRRRRRRERLLCARGECSSSLLLRGARLSNKPRSKDNCEFKTRNDSEDIECDSGGRKFAVCVVDKNGGHSLIKQSHEDSEDSEPRRFHGLVDFPLSEYIDDDEIAGDELALEELEEAEERLLAGSRSCDFCPECQREAAAAAGEMRGWPEGFDTSGDDELSLFEPTDLWPVARLQENPLISATTASGGPVGTEEEDEQPERALDRSRLLSMREGQEQNRAAIRMISSDSVQLLVSASSPAAAQAAGGTGRLAMTQAAGPRREDPDPELPARAQSGAQPGELARASQPAVECPPSVGSPQVEAEESRTQREAEQVCSLEAALERELWMQPARPSAAGLLGRTGRQRQLASSRSSVAVAVAAAAAVAPAKTQNRSLEASPSQRSGPLEHSQINLQNTNNNNINHNNKTQNLCDVPRQPDSGNQQHLLTTADELKRARGAAEWPAMAAAAAASPSGAEPVEGEPLAGRTFRTEPIPTPRGQQHQQQHQSKTPINDQLSILTNQLNPRLRDISGLAVASPSSVLSDSTFAAEVSMNPSALIPKLIERLHRKLAVMKEEQLRLTKEIETNELAGQRLFDSMRRQLANSEFDKISLHANEIEKVTKLILSLKLRLKKVEGEIKERREQAREKPPSNTSQMQPAEAPPSLGDFLSPALSAEGVDSDALGLSSAQTIVRGVSDPTSTVGLPTKRNHQHHASLQLQPTSSSTTISSATTITANSPIVGAKLSLGTAQAGSGSSSGVFGCSPRNSTELHHRRHAGKPETRADHSGNSSDSIFNCTDLTIGGSTLASHHHPGSGQNIRQEADEANISSQSSLNSSACSPGNRRANHLSSNVSVSSHSSMSSVPHSPPLMSPASTSGGLGTSLSSSGASTPLSDTTKPTAGAQYYKNFQINNTTTAGDISRDKRQQGSDIPMDSSIQPLTDLDILLAKRNKLVGQLEEAHQLEECILKRNNVIIQRILKKYYDEEAQGGEIAEFRQFTRLKSLLLKDTHYVADRIDNAELQLTELRQTNLCNV